MRTNIFLCLLVSLSGFQAAASYGRSDCSSPDGKIKYTYRFPTETGDTKTWTIDGVEYSLNYQTGDNGTVIDPTIYEKRLTAPQLLESLSDTPMSGRSIETYKVQLSFSEDANKAPIITWVICDSASGI